MVALRRLVDSPVFVGVIVAVILANALILGLQTYPRARARVRRLPARPAERALPSVFAVEISLRIASYFPRPWNYFREGLETSSTSSPSRSRSSPSSRTTRPSPPGAAGADRPGRPPPPRRPDPPPRSSAALPLLLSMANPDGPHPLRLRDSRLAALRRRAAWGLGEHRRSHAEPLRDLGFSRTLPAGTWT